MSCLELSESRQTQIEAEKGTLLILDGSVVARQYTDRDQLSQIDYNTDMVATFAYDAGSRRTSRVLGDGPGTQP